MAYQITYNAGVYEISGLLNFESGNALKDHVEGMKEYSTGIVLSLNKVLDIDRDAVESIALLYKNAWSNDHMFYVIGMKNEIVNKLFSSLKLNDILI